MSQTTAYAHLTDFFKSTAQLKSSLEMYNDYANMVSKLTNGTPLSDIFRLQAAISEVSARSLTQYDRPEFGIKSVISANKKYDVVEDVACDKDFCRLLHFKRQNKDGSDIKRNDPKVLLVAPMSGHFSTLLRNTVEELLPHHEVYITDWKNARNIELSKGDFGLDTYVEYVQEFIQKLGKNTHVIAVCQPTVPVLAAVSLLAENKKAIQPLSMTLMGGPVHPSANPTQPVLLAKEKPWSFFDDLRAEVPKGFKGAGREVYPGFLQLMGFMSMNLGRHIDSQKDFFKHLTQGNHESAERFRKFYDEYNAVMDMPWRFYKDTIRHFKNEDLVKGTMEINGRLVDPSKITKTALFTIEGENDDISAPGQTTATHKLLSGLKADKKFNFLQDKAGHYGIFNGTLWQSSVCPRVAWFLRSEGEKLGLNYTPLEAGYGIKPEKFIGSQPIENKRQKQFIPQVLHAA